MPRRAVPDVAQPEAILAQAVLALDQARAATDALAASLPLLATSLETRTEDLIGRVEGIFGALANARLKIGAVLGGLNEIKAQLDAHERADRAERSPRDGLPHRKRYP